MRGSTSGSADRLSPARHGVGVVGVLLAAYGVTGLVAGGTGLETEAVDGTVNGETWLGLEGNGWTNLLFMIAGAFLIAASAGDWTARTMAVVVGLTLGAVAIIALLDGDDVLGVFAANGWTTLAWGVAALLLLVLAAMPRRRSDAPPSPGGTVDDADRLPRDRGLTGHPGR